MGHRTRAFFEVCRAAFTRRDVDTVATRNRIPFLVTVDAGTAVPVVTVLARGVHPTAASEAMSEGIFLAALLRPGKVEGWLVRRRWNGQTRTT